MNRLTNNSGKDYQVIDKDDLLIIAEGSVFKPCISKLGQLEDIEEELNFDLITLLKALRNGIYYKKDNNIFYTNNIIRVNKYLIEVKPIYAVKETTLKTLYYGDSAGEIKNVKDAHYWDWQTSNTWNFKDYGKTWALTREELEVLK